MTTAVFLVLLVLAAACFLASALGRNVQREGRQVNLFSLGLFFWVLVPLIQTFQALGD